MTLAEIIRAQLATGRPLRVTLPLLEALVEPPAIADDLLFGTRTALCRVLDLSALVSGRQIVETVQDVVNARDEARRERDAHASRNRGATQRIIEAIGSVGPESVEDAVPRVLAKLAEALRNAQAWADERDVLRRERDEAREGERALLSASTIVRERDEARAEVERLRSLAAPVDCARLVREAEERGARWAIRKLLGPAPTRIQEDRRHENAERICAEARKAGGDE